MRTTSRVLSSAAVIALLWSWETSAMYTPNPAARWERNHFFLAGDFQFNDEKDLDPGGAIDNMVGFFARPSYSIVGNLVVYGRLGVQDADGVDAGFAGGFGVQGAYVLPRAPEWAIGGAFDFLHWSADLPGDRDIDWNEFQLAPAVSYNIPAVPELTPYAGLLFDFVDARGSLDEGDPVGLLMGTNYDPTTRVRMDAQFRVISETGFLLSVGYRF